MAQNHVYTCRWTDKDGWRWAVAVRPAPDADNEITTYTEVVVPSGVLSISTLEANYENKPYGMAAAATATLTVRFDEMTTTELQFLRSRLLDSCVVGGSQINLNSIVVTTDVGDSELAESAWPVVGVFAQPPALERDLPLRAGEAVDIEFIDAAKIALEYRAIDDQWSVPSGAVQYGFPVSALAVFDMRTPNLIIQQAGTGRSRFVMRNLQEAMQTMAIRLGSWAYQAVRNRAMNASAWATEHLTNFTMPFGAWWTFHAQDQGSNNIGQPAATPIGSDDVWYCMVQDVAGFELGNSQYNLRQRYDNWWNAVQALAELAYSKARIIWAGSGVLSTPLPAVQYDQPFGGFGDDPIDVHVATAGSYATIMDESYKVGFEVLRSAKCQDLPRNKDTRLTIEDATEWEYGASNSVANTEYGIPEAWFLTTPEAADVFAGIGSINPFQRNIWFGTLYNQYETGRFCRLHHHVVVDDGVDQHELPTTDMVVDSQGRIDGSPRSVWAARIQREHGGIAGTLAYAVYQSFGRRNQGKLSFAYLGKGREPFLLSALGRTVQITSTDDLDELYGAEIWLEPAVITRISMDLASCKTTVECFVRGSKGPL